MRTRRPGTPEEPLQEFSTIEQLSATEVLGDGRFSLMHGPYPVDFLFRDNAADSIVVTFHGAALKAVSLPWHNGKGVMEGVHAKWLAISDPSLLIHENLSLAWYAGSGKQPQLQSFIGDVVEEVLRKSGATYPIFLGGSGGGFAALEMSRRFSKSLVIPMNPQTMISNYVPHFVKSYLRRAWSAEDLSDPALSQICHDLVKAYDLNHQNTIAYVQNTRDGLHVQEHQRPFFDKLHASPNLWLKTGSWGNPSFSGHVIPPKGEINEILKQVAATNGKWTDALASLDFRQAPFQIEEHQSVV